MSAEVLGISEGLVTLRIAGRLTEAELAAANQGVADFIRSHGNVRILVLADGFEGWDQGGHWDDFTLQEENDQHIEKMAIVGDTRWEELALLFTAQGLRPFPIEYFLPSDLPKAQAWLAA